MNLDEYQAKATKRILAYGRAKTGKDVVVGQLARKFHLHWLDLEDGIKSLLNPEMLPPEFRKNITVHRIPDHQLVPMAIETMLKVIKGDACYICYEHGKVACPKCGVSPDKAGRLCLKEFQPDRDILVINSITQLSNSAMYAVIKSHLENDEWDYKPTFHDYRAQGFMLDRIFSTMQAGNFNCVCVSHEVESEMEDGTTKIVPAAGTRNFSRTFGRYFDEVVYLDIVNKRHRSYSSSIHNGNILTGSRTGTELEKVEGSSLLTLHGSSEKVFIGPQGKEEPASKPAKSDSSW